VEKEDIMTQTSQLENRDMEGCVMLALSTFRRSEDAIDIAIEKCKGIEKLIVVYVVDINTERYLHRYFDEERLPNLKEICEAESLKKSEQLGRKLVTVIAEKARESGIKVKRLVQVGRFGVICLELVRQINPSVIVTQNSKRPEWVKEFYGAPVDELIAKAGCPVIVI
jgi:nucleotide-binding universal stress UspA family protein